MRRSTRSIHVFGRFSRFTDILSGASLFGPAGGPGLGIAGFGGVSNGANDSLALGTDIAINSKLVTDVRLGYFRYNIITRRTIRATPISRFLGENVQRRLLPLAQGNIRYAGHPDRGHQPRLTFRVRRQQQPQNQGPQFGSRPQHEPLQLPAEGEGRSVPNGQQLDKDDR